MQIIPYSENELAVNPNNKNIKQEKEQNKSKKWIAIIILLLLLFIIILVVLIYLFVLRKKPDNNVEENNLNNILNNTTNTTNTNSITITEEQCEIGDGEKCKTCNSNLKLKYQCWDCNDGYYLPTDGSKKKCQSCGTIQNCIECSGTKDDIQCSKCEEGFNLIYNKCVKIKMCTIGNDEKCASCNTEIGREKKCGSCNEGYFLPDNTNHYTCSECSTSNCKICSGLLNEDKCYECKEGFEPVKVSYDGVISVRSCDCPDNSRMINGKCVEYANGFEIVHYAYYDNFPLLLMNDNQLNLRDDQLEVYINDTLVNFQRDGYRYVYQYPETGIHIIRIIIKKN